MLNLLVRVQRPRSTWPALPAQLASYVYHDSSIWDSRVSDSECRQLRGAYVTGPLIEQLLGDAVRLSASREGSRKPPGLPGDLIYLHYFIQSQKVGTVLLNMRKLQLR